MITKIGKQAFAELSDDEASSMRRTHLVKGLLTPFVAGPIGTLVGSKVGSGIGRLIAKLPMSEERADRIRMGAGRKGAAAGGLLALGLGIRHLLNAAAGKKYLEKQKERNSIIDW